MESSTADLQSSILSNNNNSRRRSRRRFRLLNPSSFAVRQNLTEDVRQNINDSIYYNLGLMIISILKLIVSGLVLTLTPRSCEKPIDQWLMFMMGHDFLYSITLILTIKTIMNMNYNTNREDSENNDYEDEEEQENPTDSVFGISEEAEKNNRMVSALNAICKTLYYALFLYGQILYFQSNSNCAQTAPTVTIVAFVYLCFGYLYLGLPLIFIILACLCMPFLLFCFYLFSRGDQVPANTAAIEKLPVITYTGNLPGNQECSICMVEYKEGDQLIQLPCSNMHHFHDDCLKKWLKINGLCPICRSRIDGKKPRTQGVEMGRNMPRTDQQP